MVAYEKRQDEKLSFYTIYCSKQSHFYVSTEIINQANKKIDFAKKNPHSAMIQFSTFSLVIVKKKTLNVL